VLEEIAEGLPDRVREQINAALMIKPDNYSAHMLLANWHAAIINDSGFDSRMIYGADEEEVFVHYAERLGPAGRLAGTFSVCAHGFRHGRKSKCRACTETFKHGAFTRRRSSIAAGFARRSRVYAEQPHRKLSL